MSDLNRESMRDLAAAYAIGALDADELREFESLLGQSEELRREVAEFEEVSAQLAHGAPQAEPDTALRRRLMDRAKVDAVSRPAAPPSRSTNWMLGLAWAAAATGIIVAFVQSDRAGDLEKQLAARAREVETVLAQLDRSKQRLDDVLGATTVMFVLRSTSEQPPSIRLYWNQQENNIVLQTIALAPAPTGREYQLWFLSGGAALPASTFNSDAGGSRVTLPGPPPDTEIQGVAITIEPIGGSAQPTTPIILLSTVAIE